MRSEIAKKIHNETPKKVKDKVRRIADRRVLLSKVCRKWREFWKRRLNRLI